MIKNEYKVIGVMSGTSLDGIDLALVTFNYDGQWDFNINIAETIPYSKEWLSELKGLINYSKETLQEIDERYTKYLGNVVGRFIADENIENIDAICSHGHTALHQPENKLTYQIGNLPELADQLKLTIVCDFRIQDVEFNGQGAPLVPIGDQLLFENYEYCINLGGFANVSTIIDSKRIAFDICPMNIVLNKYVSTLDLSYDDKGIIASRGIVHLRLLEELNGLKFYKESFPKSLGLEWVNEVIFPLIDSFDLSLKDILRTFVEHIAIQISNVINEKNKVSVLITGGGVYNEFLMSRIETLSNNEITIPPKDLIEFKEALIFGFLGILKLRGEDNCLSSVTGAVRDHSSGKIFSFNI